jgi:hypothetical protein
MRDARRALPIAVLGVPPFSLLCCRHPPPQNSDFVTAMFGYASRKRQRVNNHEAIVDPIGITATTTTGSFTRPSVISTDRVYNFSTNKSGRRRVSIQASQILVALPALAPPLLSSSGTREWSSDKEHLVIETLAGIEVATNTRDTNVAGTIVSNIHSNPINRSQTHHYHISGRRTSLSTLS